MKIKIIILGFFILSFCQCSNKTTALGYMQYFTKIENGLSKKDKINNITYKVQFKDANFITIQQLGLNNFSKASFDSITLKRKNYYEFMFRISSDTTGDYPFFKFITKDEQQLYDLNQFFMLNNGQFTLMLDSIICQPCTYFFTPNTGAVPYEEFTIGYILPEIQEQKFKKLQFIYDDKIFKKGSIYFTFNKETILKIPSLQL